MRVADILWVEAKDAAQDTHDEELPSPTCEWEGLASGRSHASSAKQGEQYWHWETLSQTVKLLLTAKIETRSVF